MSYYKEHSVPPDKNMHISLTLVQRLELFGVNMMSKLQCRTVVEQATQMQMYAVSSPTNVDHREKLT